MGSGLLEMGSVAGSASRLNCSLRTEILLTSFAVCNWWHETPQLFFRVPGWGTFTPCSCAHVDLVPEYI